MQEYVIENDGRKRPAKKVICDYCNTEFLKALRFIKDKNYCNQKCAASSRRKTIIVDCAQCGEKIERSPSELNKSKSGLYFCNRECKEKAQTYMKEIQPNHYRNEGLNYRKTAFEAYGKICNECGYDNELVLEVHHIDKDRANNKVENLKVLCANCHTIIHKLGNGLGDPENPCKILA